MSESKNTQYALICYRDHPPQDNTYITRVFDLTDRIQVLKTNVDTMAAHGGGDGPESVCCGLKAVLDLNFRKDSVKVVVVIADAPPHGILSSGDGFPNGCPDGIDPLEIAETYVARGIIVYVCGIETGLRGTGIPFFKAIAKKTGGRYLKLDGASILPSIIVGAAREEVTLNQVNKAFEEEMDNVMKTEEGKNLNEDQIVEKIYSNMNLKGIQTGQLNVTNQSEENNVTENKVIDIFYKAKDLAEARNGLTAGGFSNQSIFPPTSYSRGGPRSYSGRGRAINISPKMNLKKKLIQKPVTNWNIILLLLAI